MMNTYLLKKLTVRVVGLEGKLGTTRAKSINPWAKVTGIHNTELHAYRIIKSQNSRSRRDPKDQTKEPTAKESLAGGRPTSSKTSKQANKL